MHELLKLAVIYAFKGRDKLSLVLNYAAMLCIGLSVAILITILACLRGYLDLLHAKSIADPLAQLGSIPQLYVFEKSASIKKEIKSDLIYSNVDLLNSSNLSLIVPDSLAGELVVQTLEFQMGVIGYKTKDSSRIQQAPVIVVKNDKLAASSIQVEASLFKSKDYIETFFLINPQSNSMAWGVPSVKNYSINSFQKGGFELKELNNNKHGEYGFADAIVVKVSSSVFDALFGRRRAVGAEITVKDPLNIEHVKASLKSSNPYSYLYAAGVHKFPELMAMMDLQRQIIMSIYGIVLLLLCLLIISLNLIFYKEKRKDWALIQMLNFHKESVSIILTLRIFIVCFSCIGLGIFMGILSSAHFQDLVSLINLTQISASDALMANIKLEDLHPRIALTDIFHISKWVFMVYAITLGLQIYLFKSNPPAQLLKQGA